ncbi:DMT family transporter [Candidatus Dojkabacteria bacterium]|nr:DMT family transporter [Candidatus Dojkabacteria bacterium]
MIYLLPLLAGILYGIGGLVNKKVANLVNNPLLSSLLFNFFSLIAASLLLIYDITGSGILISNNYIDWLLILAGTIIISFSFWGLFTSMRELPVSEQILLSRASVLTYTIGGFLILGETVTQLKFVGILLVLSGILVSSIRKGKFVFNKWVLIQLLSSFGFGLTVLIDNYISKDFSTGAYVFINIVTTTIALFIWAMSTGALKEIKKVPKGYILNTAIAGAFSLLAYYLIIKSYDLGGLVVITGALSQIKLPLIVLGAYIFYKEKSDLFVKLLGVITVVAGLILLKI